jgi:hypothetical protein
VVEVIPLYAKINGLLVDLLLDLLLYINGIKKIDFLVLDEISEKYVV